MTPTDYKVKSFTLYIDGKEYFISLKNKFKGVEIVLVSVPNNKCGGRPINFKYKNQFESNKDYIKAVLTAIRFDVRRIFRSIARRVGLKK